MNSYRNDYSHTDILEIEDTDYLVQGDLQDPVTMFRPVNELLECERDNVQERMYSEELENEVYDE